MLAGWLAKWLGRKAQGVDARGRETGFAVESLEPRLLLSTTLGSEQLCTNVLICDPAGPSPLAAITLDLSVPVATSQSEGLHFSWLGDGSVGMQENEGSDLGEVARTSAVDAVIALGLSELAGIADESDTGPAEATEQGAGQPDGAGTSHDIVAQVQVRATDTFNSTDDSESEVSNPLDSSNSSCSTEALVAALHAANPPPQGAAFLSGNSAGAAADLGQLIEEAIRQWSNLPAADGLQTRLAQVKIEVADLPGATLAQALGDTILLDTSAAGYGWFIDPTPSDNSEFTLDANGGLRFADSTSPAYGQIDLLSVVTHELGHVLGFEDLDPSVDPAAIMAGSLSLGQRRLATDSVGTLGTASCAYGSISGANLTIAGGGATYDLATPAVPYGDLTSVTAGNADQAAELDRFFRGVESDGTVSFAGSVTIAGQLLTGSFALRQETDRVVGGAAWVTASLMSDNVGVQIAGGSGGFVLTAGGTALDIEGTASFVNMPGLALSGTLAVRINTLGATAPASAAVPDPADPASTISVTFGFDGDVNAFEGDPTIQILGSDAYPLIDISGSMRIADNGTGVLVFGVTGLNVTIYASGVEVFSVDTTYGQFALAGASFESPGFQLVKGSINPSSTAGRCEIAGISFTQDTPDEYAYAVVGPFKMNGATPLLAAFRYYDRSLDVSVGAKVNNLKLSWEKGEGEAKKEYSFEIYFANFTVGLGTTVSATTELATGNLTGTGLFSILSTTAGVKIGEILTGSAYNISAQYDPAGAEDQELFRADYLDITIKPIKLQFQLRPYTDGGTVIPGLVVRKNGFQLGRGRAILKVDGSGGDNDPDSSERMVGFTGPYVDITDLGFTAGEAFSFSGTVSVGASAVRIGKKDSTFAAHGTNVIATLQFSDNLPSGFQFKASELSIKLASYIEISTAMFEFNPQATGAEEIVSFNLLTATLKLGEVQISGSISAFAIDGDGNFVTHSGFGASFSIGEDKGDGATSGLKWPAWLPIKSASVGVEWPSFATDPANFRLVLGITVDANLGPISLGGSISGAVIDIGLLAKGKFPLIRLGSASISAGGKLGAAEVSGSLIVGLVRFDEYGVRIPEGDIVTPVADSIFYGGIDAGLTIAGKGFHLRLGISEKGPLSAYVSIDAPIILEPNSGLTIDKFRGGITFNALPFPEIDTTAGLDSVASQLRSPRFRPTGEIDVTQWQAQLEQQVINQAGGQFGYLFSIADTPVNIQKHVEAMNTTATILDEDAPGPSMKRAFLDHGYPMSSGFASVTVLKADWAWIVAYQGFNYLVEKRIPDTGTEHLLNISRLTFAVTDIPPPEDSLYDLDLGVLTDALKQAFTDAGLELSDSATIEVKTPGEEWFVRDGGAEYLLRSKGPNTAGNYSLAVLTGTASSMNSLNLGVIKIEAGCTLYFQATSEKALRGEVDLVITTDGQFLISGKLVFADGQLTATAKMFADLRDIASGSGKLYFLMDVPDEPRVLTVVGTLTFGFIDLLGNTLTRAEGETAEQFAARLAQSDASFQIKLDGKGELTAAGFLGIVCEGNLTLTFSETRFELEFDVSLSIEGLISADGMVSAAGILVLQNNQGEFEMWGVMKLNVDSSTLEPLATIGISFEADVILKINIGGPAEGRDVTLKLPGRDPETFHLPQNSFALYIYGDATLCPPGGLFSLEMTGAFSLELSTSGLRIFLLASFEFEVLEVPLMKFEALGLMAIVINYDEDGVVTGGGFAARLELARRLEVPGIEFDVEFQLYINTLGEEVVYELPEEFADKLGETLPEDLAARIEGGQVSVPAGAPRLAGLFLVGLESGYETTLNQGSVPEGLRTKFKDNGCRLASLSPTVAVLESGSTWLVTDQVSSGGETYVARYLIEKTEAGSGLIVTSVMFQTDSTSDTVTALDGRTIPGSLRQLFADNALSLAGDASLSVVQTGAAWLIESGVNRYLIEKHGGKLLVMEPREGPPGFYLVVAGGGSLTLLDTFVLEGRFRIQGSTTGFEMEVYAGLELGPLGHLRAAGVLSITGDGLVAALELELEAGLPLGPNVGIDIQGKFALAINTTGDPVNVNVPTSGGGTKLITLPATSVQIHVEGSIDFLGFIQASGWLDIFLSNERFTLAGHISFALSDFINTSADVLVHVVDDGVVIYANVSLDVNLPSPSVPIFHIAADGTLEVNTTNADYDYQPGVVLEANSFLLDLNGELGVLGVLTLDTGFTIQVGGGTFTHSFPYSINHTPFGNLGSANYSQTLASGEWAIGFDAEISFFGLATLGGSGWLNSAGDFDIRVAGELVIGVRSFGLIGEFHFRVWLDEDQFGLKVGASVDAKVFGITLAGVGFDAGFTASRGANSSGRVSIDLSVTAEIKLLFVTIEKTATFHLGVLQLPPVPHLATREGDGTLRLNVGSRATYRGVAKDLINETYYIEHVAPQDGDPAGERIRVTAFGYSEEYTGITKIVGDGGTGDDVLVVRPNKDSQRVIVAVEFYGGAGDDALVYDGAADSTKTIKLDGGGGDDYLEIGEFTAATVQLIGGTDSGRDQLFHHGSGPGTLTGGGGADEIVGGSGADNIQGGDGDDKITGNGGNDTIDAGAGDDTIYWKAGDGIDTSVVAGSGTDTFVYTGSSTAERFRISADSSYLYVATLTSAGSVIETLTASGIEQVYVDAGAGGDEIEVMDLAGSTITQVKVDLGRVISSQTTVIIGQDLDKDGVPDVDSQGRLVAPEEITVYTYANDNAADVLTIRGQNSGADDLVLYTDTTWLLAGETLNEVRVKYAAADTDMYLIYNGLRNGNAGQTDRLIIDTGGGNDKIDASGVVDADLLVLELVAGGGNDTLIGSPYGDVLDGGLGNDTVTGGAGTDTFRDAGGYDTLVEQRDKDLALFGNRFVVGTITDVYGGHTEQYALINGPQEDVWNDGAEVEDITGGTGSSLFEEARISGGANSNILVVGDRNGSIRVGSTNIAVTSWSGKVTLDNRTNSGDDLSPEKYIVNLTGTGTGNVWIEDSGGAIGNDALWVFGTDNADTLTLDKDTIGGAVYGKVLVSTAGAAGTDTVYYHDMESFAVSTLGGADVLQLNDNLNTTYIYTGAGDDQITIGHVGTKYNDENIPVVDFATTTNGISAETFIYGGADNDSFEINHNLAVLWLYGEDGNDRFVQYSFLVDLRDMTPPVSGEADVTLNGGTGANRYEIGDPGPLNSTRYVYLKNNLVHIEGGAGTDTYVIVGSPLDDLFILTANYLLGGGLNTTFAGIERLELDTGGGDDVVYVLGSPAGMEVGVTTGSGNDTVHIGGEAPAMKIVAPAHLVTPDPVLRQDMRKIYPFATQAARAGSKTYSYAHFLLSNPVHLAAMRAAVTREWVTKDTAYYTWHYPEGVYWAYWDDDVINREKNDYVARAGSNFYWQAKQPVDAYPAYSFLSTQDQGNYLTSAFGATRLDQTTRGYVWDSKDWDEHQYVYYAVEFNYTLPQVGYVDLVNWRYMAPYAYSPPTTQVPQQEYWVMLPRVSNLSTFQGQVTVDGGASTYTEGGQQVNHTDQLFIHNEDGPASSDGHLTDTSLTGLGLPSGGIEYSNFEELDIRLGSNDDKFTVDGTHAGKTDLVLGNGDDEVTVKAVSGETNILGGAGADTVTVQGNSASGLAGIAAHLHFFGNAHRYDQSTGTGEFKPVAVLDANGQPVMEWINFTELGDKAYFTDAAVFSNTGSIQAGQTQWQYGTQLFQADGKTPRLQNFTVQRQQVKTTSTELHQVTRHDVTVSDSATDRLIITDSSAYTGNTTGIINANSVTGLGMAATIGYEQLEDLKITLGGGADTLSVEGLSTPAEINGGPGGDTITIQNGNRPITVNGQGGQDTVNVRQISQAMTVNGGLDNDTVNVGSLAPATGGNVNGISALLTVHGDGGSDTLNVDDTSDTAGNTGTLTGTQLTGLGMTAGITYGTLEALNINLGSGGDAFTVASTHPGTTTVNTNAGADTVRVKAIAGATTVDTGSGRDAIQVWNDSTCLDDIDAALTVSAGEPANFAAGDLLDIRDTGNSTGRSGTLTDSTLSGLGMGGSIAYSGVEDLDLALGSGPDTLRIKSISAVTTVATGAGDDQINVWSDVYRLDGIVKLLTIDAGDPSASDSLDIRDTGNTTGRTGSLTASTVTGLGMPDGIAYQNAETLTLSLGTGSDTFTIQSTHGGTTTLNAGGGSDVVTVETVSGVTTINAEGGADFVHVRTINAGTTVNGGLGNDTVNVGSLAPATGGNVNGILALLTVNGDGGSDTLNVDDTSDTAANTGTLTGTQLTGLGMTAGITYGTLEALNIDLGSGGDTFTIESTHLGATTVNMNAGADTVRLQSVAGATTVNTGTGRDTINVWNDSNCLDDIDAVLTVDAGEPANFAAGDLLDIRDTGNSTGRSGTLTDSTLSGLGMGGSIAYSGVEDLDLALGSGPDTLRIKSISAVTTVATGAGDDQINVWSDAYRLDGIVKLLTIDAGDPSASDSLDIRDTGNTTGRTGLLTASTVTGLGMPDGIVYRNVEALTISLGTGPDTFTIQATHGGTTMLNTGDGNDVVTVETISGVTTINAEGGADFVHVRTINAATTVNGGLGNDTVNVGSLAPATNGNVNSILALLTVNGDGGSDTLNVDDTGDTAANVGTLTGTQLTGLGMSDGIIYGTLEDLNINLGSGGDTFTIESTHAGTTDLNANAGADVVNVRTTAGQTVVDTAAGGDTINVGSLAPAVTGGTLNGMAGLVIVRAGEGTADTLNVDDSGNPADNTGEMTGTGITGLGMGGGIEYYDLETLNIWLGQGSDTFTAHSTHTYLTNLYAGAGADTVAIEDASGMTNIYGGEDDDRITVDTLVHLATATTGDTVNLDGQAGSDAYTVNITGSGDYLVNVLDTGTGGDDTLTVNGTTETDSFLLRASEHDYTEGGIAFVAALHGSPVSQVERINYNKAVEGLTVYGDDGDDTFTLDDNWTPTTIRGGEGNDVFQVGQIFKTQRDAYHANIAGEDEFATTLTTRGYLSNGVSYETTIKGNDGNDEFVVFRNTAPLHLFGGDGDDTFTIRAFALEGSHTTELTGEGGADYVEYVINAPVNVLGGDGTDTLRVIGTEFSDQIVVTAAGVFGMGVNVTYDEIERLEIDAAEGNDTFYVLSTREGVETWLYGGLGSDRFSIAGDVPQIVSGSTEIHPATPGSHKVDGIQGLLHIEGMAGQGSTGGLGTPVMLPGETNVLPSDGDVRGYDASTDTMTVATADLQRLIDADASDALISLADFIGLTLEISQGPGVGRFWQIIDVQPVDDETSALTLKSPTMPAAEWGLPDATSEFAITHLSSNFFVTEESQVDFATVYNDAATVDQAGVLTATTLTGLGMGPDGITYGSLEVLDIFLGSGADSLFITGAMQRDDGFQTVTMVNTGAGNDDVTVSLATGGLFALNTEAGNDHIHAVASTLPLILFGGEGDDLIESGQGDDVIFGDRGRIDYRNADGTLVTRLGLGLTERYVLQPGEIESSSTDVPFKQTDGVARRPVLVTTRDAATGGADTIYGSDGDDIILGGAAGDTIHAGHGNNIVLGDDGYLTYADSNPSEIGEIVSTSTTANGGADMITTGNGDDVIIGGRHGDTINAGDGDNLIIGDSGQIVFANGILAGIETTEPSDGGADDIASGAGNDTILGGQGGDAIAAGDGMNVVLGDNGLIDYAQGTGAVHRIETIAPAFGGDDHIATGAGDDIILGGAEGDTIHAGHGDNVVLGDDGHLAYAGNAPSGIGEIVSTSTTANGGADTITTGSGDDVIIGGRHGDTINAGNGNNIVLGDSGQIVFASGVLADIETMEPSDGGADDVAAGAGDDIILGGAEGDTIHAGDGNNLVLGDDGYIDYVIADGDPSDIDVIESTSTTAAGGADTITTGAGDDVVIGGRYGDVIEAGDGNNLVLGDSGRITAATSNAVQQLGGIPMTLGLVETVASVDGGDDTITTGIGNDLILGGQGGDTIEAGQGTNLVLGDNGLLDYTRLDRQSVAGADSDPSDLDLVMSIDEAIGGSDTITTGDGSDLVIGGAAGDAIEVNNGNNLVLGDSGVITAASVDGPQLAGLPLTIGEILTTADGIGGSDRITAGSGDDILVGGTNDAGVPELITAGEGNNIVLGDSGRIDYTRAEREGGAGADTNPADLDLIESTSTTEFGGMDMITSGSGSDLILGGRFGDVIAAGDGNNLVLGDSGRITAAAADGPQLNGIPMTLGLVETVASADGGDDTITTGVGNDLILGGQGGDTIHAGDGNNIVVGDNGFVDYIVNGDPTGIDMISTVDPVHGGADRIVAGDGNDFLLGGTAGDTIHAGAGNDLIFGDFGRIEGDVDAASLPPVAGHPFTFTSIHTQNSDLGSGDVIYGEDGEDIILGGQGADRVYGGADDDDIIGGHNVPSGSDEGDFLDGGAGNDVIAGDNASVLRRGDALSERFRVLDGQVIYDADGVPQTTGAPQFDPTGVESRTTALYEHSATAAADTYGDDYIAGGADDDVIFGQLGDDVIQGDGSIDFVSIGNYAAIGTRVGAARDEANALLLNPSFEDATDGDDYIEGNGGNDVIFGNLGQDDLIGGSSNLFGLTTPGARPDGSDLIFGGAGTDILRNDAGDGSHGRDADMILGDNGNIFRLVGTNGTVGSGFLTFNYDNYGTPAIIPRAAELLDYTPGGHDYDAASATNDIGAADEIHGESGDDFLYGMKGDDVLFGEGQDDDLIGGYGHDWISGGTGQDGVLGDDGRIYTSRNGTPEPLYGIAATTESVISTPGKMQQATINVTGELKKSVNLTPYNPDPTNNELFDASEADDIIYGGLGSDFLHGGSGDDAISGAEAPDSGVLLSDGEQGPDYHHPFNPGNVLGYSPGTGEFAQYDENHPLIKIAGFLLNFSALEGSSVTDVTWGTVNSDGDDKIFGDLGNDWLVGGTGRDNLYGGWGDDLLNADDDHDTNGGLNDGPDTHPSYEDRAYGGAGRDRLIGNTGGDRLIDWAGEFNSYIVPFAPFGIATVCRSLQPQLAEFLYALSASDGADATRAADAGGDPIRNGEPYGELGLVRQQDTAWGAQTGAPDDPQPGNTGGRPRDVLRSASSGSSQIATQAFAADSGTWTTQDGVLQVAADSPHGDAVAICTDGEPLPVSFQVQASLQAAKPTGGWNANSYIIFDYVSPTDFKFAGIDVSTNKLQIGHRDAGGWHIDAQTNINVKPDRFYDISLVIDGLNVTIALDDKTITSTFAPRVVDGYSYTLNWGLVGMGSNNSRSAYDNVRIQVLSPETAFEFMESFSDGIPDPSQMEQPGSGVSQAAAAGPQQARRSR